MKTYSIGQLQDMHDYLGYSVKEGYLDESVAEDIENRQAWNEVEEMMWKGDEYANENA